MLLRNCKRVASSLCGLSQLSSRQYSTCIVTSSSNTYSLRTHTCGELTRDHVGQSVTLYGWLSKPRILTPQGVAFLPVHDTTGVTQFVCDLTKWQHDLEAFREKERVVKVGGVVKPRPPEAVNTNLPTGEIEVELGSLEVINEATHHPFSTFGRESEKNKDISIEQQLYERPHYLRLQHMQRNIQLRSNIGMSLRKALIGCHGFIEIETPTLFKKTPEGAQEFIVPTRTPGKYFSLAQSPQQFKQLLMVAGFDRYFQFARCYRDEDQRSDRQPEFTQIDLEMSFVDSDCVMRLTEDILHSTVSSLCPHLSIPSLPFPRMEYRHAMENYGTDKPDTRFEMLIKNLDTIWVDLINDLGIEQENLLFPHVYTLHVPQWERAMSNLKTSDRTKFKETSTKIRELKERYSTVMIGSDINTCVRGLEQLFNTFSSDALLKFTTEIFEKFSERMRHHLSYEDGDMCVLGVCETGSEEKTLRGLGAWRTLAADVLHHVNQIELDSTRLDFLWVVGFPLFNVLEIESGGYDVVATHHPFTAPIIEHTHLLQGEPSVEQLSQV